MADMDDIQAKGAAAHNKRTATKPVEVPTRYSAQELTQGAAAFGTTPEVVAGAIRLAGLSDGATKQQAQDAIRAYQKREVR